MDDVERAEATPARFLPPREGRGQINLDSEESYRYIQQDRVRVAATEAGAGLLRHPPRGIKEWIAYLLADLRLQWRTVGSRRGAEDRVSPAGGVRNEDLDTIATADGRWLPVALDRFGRVLATDTQVLAALDALGHAEDAPHTSGDQGVLGLTVRRDTPTASAGADGDYQVAISDLMGRVYSRQIPDRPSQGTGRSHVEVDTGGIVTADTNLRTNTAGKTFFVHQLYFAAYNTSTSANGVVLLRDGVGGTIKRTYLMSPAGLAAQLAASAAVAITETFPEPLIFTVGVYLDISTGTITMAAGATGYEE